MQRCASGRSWNLHQQNKDSGDERIAGEAVEIVRIQRAYSVWEPLGCNAKNSAWSGTPVDART